MVLVSYQVGLQRGGPLVSGRGISPLLLAFLETAKWVSPLTDVHAEITTDTAKVVNHERTVPVRSRAGAVLAKVALLSRQSSPVVPRAFGGKPLLGTICSNDLRRSTKLMDTRSH